MWRFCDSQIIALDSLYSGVSKVQNANCESVKRYQWVFYKCGR